MNKTENYYSPHKRYGAAAKYTRIEEDGTMWIGNHEYETQVNFCPWTGIPAKTCMTIKSKGLQDSYNAQSKTKYTEYEK